MLSAVTLSVSNKEGLGLRRAGPGGAQVVFRWCSAQGRDESASFLARRGRVSTTRSSLSAGTKFKPMPPLLPARITPATSLAIHYSPVLSDSRQVP
jgi:hypothetical protein